MGRMRVLTAVAAVAAVLVLPVNVTAQLPEWQVNQPGSSLDIDGVQATPFSSAVTTACVGAPVTVTFASTNVGLAWEAGIGFLPLVPRSAPGSLGTSGGQVVNLDIADPALTFLLGGATPAFTPFPGGFAAVVTSGPAPITATIQQVVADPVLSDGFALSQGCQLDTVLAGGSVPGPFDDIGAQIITFGAPPLCGPQSVPFFGTAYTQMVVTSDGRIVFGMNFSAIQAPMVAVALTDDPSFGAWCNLDPSSGGSITTSIPAPGVVQATWLNVPFSPYLTPATPVANFSLQIDASGTVTILGIPGLVSTTSFCFLGISAGILGATDVGQVNYTPSGVLNAGPPGLGMIYRLTQAAAVAPLVNSLTFVPNPFGNYDWTGI